MEREKLYRLLRLGLEKGASDIHFQVGYLPLYRFHGELVELRYKVLTPEDTEEIARVLIENDPLGQDIDFNERDLAFELPGEGRFRVNVSRQRRFFNIVLRVIPLQIKSFADLNLPSVLSEISQIQRGYVLVTGPTGMGKSTTLAAMLNEVNRQRKSKIVTVEDPIEFVFTHDRSIITQREIGTDTASFPDALRAALRQDPDIIMVGEIRDFETAEISVKAALTGHMVLSTLHTNDAPSTINRLLNMGIEPFLVASAVNCIVAQRLARRICAECVADDTEIEHQQLVDVGLSEKEIKSYKPRKGQGCGVCADTGFKGRVAIYEVMVMTDQLKEFVLNGASGAEIKREAIRGGMVTLRRSGLNMMLDGVTTISEVFRVSMSD